jgi:hypothetical protein
MKTFSLILLSLLIGLSISDRSFAEVYTTGSAADNNNNIIVIGYCLGNVRIMGQEFSTSTPSTFMLKLNSDGDLLWIKILSSSQTLKASAVTFDLSGNIYITGEFSGTASLGSYVLNAQAIDMFVLKADQMGNVVWAKNGVGAADQFGRDIYFGIDGLIYIGGSSEPYGAPFSFDTLNTQGGGFILKMNDDGIGLGLYGVPDIVNSLTVDSGGNIVVGLLKYYGKPYWTYWGSLRKYDNNGGLIWQHPFIGYRAPIAKILTDTDLNIIEARTDYPYTGLGIFLSKYSPAGTSLFSKPFYYSGASTLKMGIDNNYIIQGYYINNFQMGDSTLSNSGAEDAFIAKIDTGFNPIWFKHGGGVFRDEFGSSALLNDGSIISCAHFRGQINFDNFQMSGGLSVNDQWAALIKFDTDGNILWFKKIAENFSAPSIINWVPLEIGNKIQYITTTHTTSIYYTQHSLRLFHVTDSIWIDGKKYFSVNGFYNFYNGVKIRYDNETPRLFVLYQNQEYLFMDFSKMAGETFQQIQNNGSFLNTSIIERNRNVIGDTIATKGFYNSSGSIYNWCDFAPEIGWVSQNQQTQQPLTVLNGASIIEYLIHASDTIMHKKHPYVASINFDQVLFIADTNRIKQEFIIDHPNSKQYYPAANGFLTYINAYLQSFYSDGADTIWNSNFYIQQLSAVDFSLNYQFDTTKYQQGYHLYYRIAAVDKGILPDTFYSPQSGYYKLFWKDSTTSVSPVDFLPSEYSLSQNFPNPFNPSSNIVFTIPERNFVSLKVFDLLGSEIISLVNEELDAGRYEVEFSGNDLSSGIYIYQIRAGSFIDTKKMILLR